MPRIRRVQSSFNSGVLDPRINARIDVKAYYQGAAKLDDCICIPQGGASRRPGSTYLDQLTQTLTRLTGMTITTPNGGTGADASDDDQSTKMVTVTGIGTIDPYVVIHYDLGSLQTIDVIDVTGISLTSSTNTTEFFMQTSVNNTAWTNFSPTLRLKSTPSSQRFSMLAIPAQYIRIVRVGSSPLTTEVVTLNELSIWQYNNPTGDSKLVPFSFNTEQNYLLLFTDRNMAVYKNDVLLTNAVSIFTEAQLADINWTQSADTLLITHVDVAPQRIVRDSAIEGAWYADPIPLQNIPTYLFAEGSGTNEIQTITFNGTWINGETYTLSLSGVLTIEITYNAVSIASDLQNALRGLSNTSSTGISVVLSSGSTYDITFSGSDGGKNWPQITFSSAVSAAGTLALSTLQKGVSGKEPTWSISRGWPKTVTFFESRMVFGGSKSRPQGLWLSVTNDLFNFDVGTGLPDEAIVSTLDTDQVNEIRHLQSGRKLEIFTSGGEFIVPTVPSIPENFSVVRQTQYGSSNVRVMSIDGSTIFVQRNGRGLREFIFSFAEDANVSNSISQLSSHLIVNPVDIDSQRGTNTDETNYIYVVNAAGDIVVLNTLREQEINAWSGPWVTDGLYKHIAVVDFQAYVVVERVVNGVTVHYLEKFDPEAFLDSSKKESGGVYQTISVPYLEGKTVRLKGDGVVFADQVVTGGVVTFTRQVTSYEVGLDFNPLIRTMPVSDAFGDGPTLNIEKRIVRVKLNRHQSLGLHVNGEVIPDRQFDVDQFDSAPDLSDEVTEIYLNGWSHTAQVDITQVDPFPMTILAVDITVSA